MNSFFASLIGTFVVANLAFAAPAQRPEELLDSYYVAADQDDSAAVWRDLNPKNWHGWHPTANIRITVKYGLLYKDDDTAFKVADWDKLPNLWDDPEVAAELEDYAEHSRGPRARKVTPSGSGFSVTTQRKVNYTWKDYQGQMLETDRFELVTSNGQLLIQSLHSTYDYR